MMQDNTTWKCPRCGKTISGNFCNNCGQKKPEPEPEEIICSCGYKNTKDAKFCANCGKSLQKKSFPPDFKKKLIPLAACILIVIITAVSCLKPHEHKWKDATCTEPKTCKTCGETTGSTASHNWNPATCTEAKTCRDCKKVSGSPAGHQWKDGSCTEPRTCTVCGENSTSTGEHQWKDATCTEPKTCTLCGETSGKESGHQWKDATCTKPKTCTLCGETSGKESGHNWKDATYDAPKTCSVCGETTGSPKVREGYTAELSGSREKVTLKDGYTTLNVTALVLDKRVTKCKELTVNMNVEMKNGTNCTDWQLWGRVNGSFQKIGSVYLPGGNGYTSQTVKFSNPVSFDALVVAPTIPGGYSWALGFTITDVWVST